MRILTVIFPEFEETEFAAPVDIFRRAGLDVTVASLTDNKLVVGRSDIKVEADKTIKEVNPDDFDFLFIPGGPGIKAVRKNTDLVKFVAKFAQSGKYVAAICAAPLILSDAGLLKNCKFTAHFSTKSELPNSITDQKVVQDGKIITSQGAGTAIELGLHIVKVLCGEQKAYEIAKAIMY